MKSSGAEVAYDQGWEDVLTGGLINPYPSGTEEHYMWSVGHEFGKEYLNLKGDRDRLAGDRKRVGL